MNTTRKTLVVRARRLALGQTPTRQLIGQLSTPLRRFLRTESGSAVILLAATVAALAWANSPWSGGYEALWETEAALRVGALEFGMDLEHWINDGLMALFFLAIGLEVRRDLSIGELTDRRRVILPLVAGTAGMVLPVLFYVLRTPRVRRPAAGAWCWGATRPSCWARWRW